MNEKNQVLQGLAYELHLLPPCGRYVHTRNTLLALVYACMEVIELLGDYDIQPTVDRCSEFLSNIDIRRYG